MQLRNNMQFIIYARPIVTRENPIDDLETSNCHLGNFALNYEERVMIERFTDDAFLSTDFVFWNFETFLSRN